MDTALTWNDDGEKKEKKTGIAHDTVFQMWEAGIRDIEEIALETAYSTTYVRQLLRGRGYDTSGATTRSPEEVGGIIADYEGGMKISKIIRKWNISNNSLYKLLEDNDIPIRKGKNKFLDKAVEMYVADATVREIFNETGVSPSVLYQALEERDIPMRNREKPNKAVFERAVALYKGHERIVDIQIETGVTVNALYQELAEQGVPTRQSTKAERLNEAIFLYERGATAEVILATTKVGSQQLYRELKHRKVPLRRKGVAQGVDIGVALELYDKGESFLAIQRKSSVTLVEMLGILKERGLALRTGLPPRVVQRSMQVAIQEYEDGRPEDDIAIDTLITLPQLLAELRRTGKAIRP